MSHSESNWEVMLPHTCQLGEGPLWDAANKRILWVDVLKGEIHQFYPDRNKHQIFTVGSLVGAIALRSSGGLVAALHSGFHFININTGEIIFIADPENYLPENRFNDGKCDPVGRFLAGTMSTNGTPGAGALYTLNADHAVVCNKRNVTCSNGLAWSLDRKTLYFIDTPTSKVMAYDYELPTGSIANERCVVQIPPNEGYPDGMTIDSEGMLWIAMWNGWQVMRWNPHTGELLKRIRLPVANVTSCVFGGNKLQDLYITSAKKGGDQDLQKTQPLAGSLFVIKNCGYEGVEGFAFSG